MAGEAARDFVAIAANDASVTASKSLAAQALVAMTIAGPTAVSAGHWHVAEMPVTKGGPEGSVLARGGPLRLL